MPRIKKEEKKEKVLLPEEQLEKFLKDHEKDHYNHEEEIQYKISTGSLIFDIHTGGGIRPSVLRFTGVTEGGKTSEVLELVHNFLKEPPGRRGLYIKAEGRLPEEKKVMSGITFVEKESEWKDGTCFIFKTNIFEAAISLMRDLVRNNPKKVNYFFVVDAMDALIPREDNEKEFEDSNKVAGGQLLTSTFLKKMALAMVTRGHICALISQIRSTIKINAYQKIDPKVTNASGGNAALHYSDWIFEVQERFKDDIIWEGEEGKSKRLGHYCKINFKKTANETTGLQIRYPIKYGQTGGNSIWKEYEVADLMIYSGLVEKSGKWLVPTKGFLAEMKEKNLKMEEKFDGIDDMRGFLEEEKPVFDALYKKFQENLIPN